MAVSLFNNFSLYSNPRLSLSALPPKTLVSHHHPHLLTTYPYILGFNSSPFITCNYRRSFTSSLTVQASTFQTNEDEGQPHYTKISESEADPRRMFTLKTLINVYKEAILDGDEKTISEVESMISIVENEKNELAQKLSTFSAEINSGKEKYIRLQADFDNFRKRSEKERLTIRSDAQGAVIESLLPMVDSFERAKQQVMPETEKEKMIDTSYQGIYKQFVEILRSLRVAAVPTVGKPFDPSVHEAIGREESQEYREGIVIQEFRRGFIIGDRLIRPAMVKVSTGPGKRKPTIATEKSTTAAGLDDR